jgi:hypothetical protein
MGPLLGLEQALDLRQLTKTWGEVIHSQPHSTGAVGGPGEGGSPGPTQSCSEENPPRPTHTHTHTHTFHAKL